MTMRLFISIGVLLIVGSSHAQSAFHSMTAQHNTRTYVLGNSPASPHPMMSSAADHMSSGSRYISSSHAVGAAAPIALYAETSDLPAGLHGSIRKGPPGDDDDDYDPSNPQYGALPDGTLFLLLLAAMTAVYGYISVRKKKNETNVSNI